MPVGTVSISMQREITTSFFKKEEKEKPSFFFLLVNLALSKINQKSTEAELDVLIFRILSIPTPTQLDFFFQIENKPNKDRTQLVMLWLKQVSRNRRG
ncbi:MAG: hypothetical protein Q8P67_21615 [archaeon]|nr:hypothetical protein [archaeon]